MLKTFEISDEYFKAIDLLSRFGHISENELMEKILAFYMSHVVRNLDLINTIEFRSKDIC